MLRLASDDGIYTHTHSQGHRLRSQHGFQFTVDFPTDCGDRFSFTHTQLRNAFGTQPTTFGIDFPLLTLESSHLIFLLPSQGKSQPLLSASMTSHCSSSGTGQSSRTQSGADSVMMHDVRRGQVKGHREVTHRILFSSFTSSA